MAFMVAVFFTFGTIAASIVSAFDLPTDGRSVAVASEPAKKTRRFLFRGQAPAGFVSSPTYGGTTLVVSEVSCTAASAGELCVVTATSGAIDLDPTLWRPLGNPPGSAGYRYRDRDGTRGGIRDAILRTSGKLVVRAIGSDWPFAPTGTGDRVQVRLIRDEAEFCADFGGRERRNQSGLLRFNRAPAPVFCSAACGNGVLESGEGCDPPDGTMCDVSCRRTCAADPGSTLVACSSRDESTFGFAGTGDDFALMYSDVARERGRIHAVRIDAAGQVLDQPALDLSDGSNQATDPLVIVDQDGFYGLWSGWADLVFAQGRRIPFSGLDFGPVEARGANAPHTGGQCFSFAGPPLGLGARPGGGQPFVSSAETAFCGGPIATRLTGVPGAGALLEPPYVIDVAPASFATSASTTVAIWIRNQLTPQSTTLYANWLAPAPLAMAFPLTSLAQGTEQPAVGAAGETFLAVWAMGTSVRGTRFVFPGTVLDAAGGFLIANAVGSPSLPVVTSDGSRFVVGWRERIGGADQVRAVHVATDGVVAEASPALIASAPTVADLGLAGGTSSVWAAFSTPEPSGAHAMRIAPVP